MMYTCNLAVFENGGFETGDSDGWIRGGGDRNRLMAFGIRLQDFLPGGVRYDLSIANVQSSIVTPGPDPLLSSQIPNIVRKGNYALRLGNASANGYAAVISQQINNYFCDNIYFSWLAILHAGHSVDEASILIIELRDITQGDILISKDYSASISSPTVGSMFQSTTLSGRTYYYTDWQTEHLPIDNNRKGHAFRLTILAADCFISGHLGYVYLDDFGGLAS